MEIESGQFIVANGNIESITETQPETIQMLNYAVETNDSDGSLKAGITEIVCSLPLMQREPMARLINSFFRQGLDSELLSSLYKAAGLDLA